MYAKWDAGGRGMNDSDEFHLIVGVLLGEPIMVVASSESAGETFRSRSAHPSRLRRLGTRV